MTDRGRDLVHLTTCSNQVEAGALREYLIDHGIHAYVQGEHHSSMLGQFGAFAIELRVLVPGDQVEEAAGLLEAFREAEPVLDDEMEMDAEDAGIADLDPNPPRAELRIGRTGTDPRMAALLGIVPGFGFGHFYSGAFIRGSILAGVEITGILLLPTQLLLGVGLIAVSILVDAGDGASCTALRRSQVAEQALPAAKVVAYRQLDSDDS